jgi:Na+/H+-dicarboxylate symporter
MLVVPLILSAIISGMCDIGRREGFGRIGVKVICYYIFTSLVAILTGLLLVNLLQPGAGIDVTGRTSDTAIHIQHHGFMDIVNILIRIIPSNIIKAASDNEMLGLIFFGIVFGYFINSLSEEHATTQKRFWEGVYDIMIHITNLVMKFAPAGVFGLVGEIVSKTGPEKITGVAMFFITVITALAVHMFITMPLLLKLLASKGPGQHFKALAPALLTAFSTSSSSATLPLTMKCVEDNANVPKSISSFVLPLGATVNMDGTALYECVAVIFIAQAYGIHLSFLSMFIIVITALVTSIGVAGIPSASLVAITLILTSTGLPLEGIGLIMIVDRILDMCRTSVNVFSDSCGAVIIAKSENMTP